MSRIVLDPQILRAVRHSRALQPRVLCPFGEQFELAYPLRQIHRWSAHRMVDFQLGLFQLDAES